MKAVGAARRAGMSTAAKRCLTTILEAELNEQALEAHTWRAKNAKRIRYVDELTRARMIEYRDNTHYVVRLYGPAPFRWTVYRLSFLTSSSCKFSRKRSLPAEGGRSSWFLDLIADEL